MTLISGHRAALAHRHRNALSMDSFTASRAARCLAGNAFDVQYVISSSVNQWRMKRCSPLASSRATRETSTMSVPMATFTER
ncbi:hypothetical protein Namu_4499 [Nakamurella multipartita DSM 44233]|uniref:Uncharacterized protein n=1 Tax=Nakamurella multipartita (strain ATCC 700099 / DSM 44233 / CIP 104796 / JCM 9543 / NBRC 105858 / Y-104) TaxID=479431 RepID=C8X6N2_NAKMY|nr:hypothetical protein Namu_4499 [Nakamurella multipartita DSM 44233]